MHISTRVLLPRFCHISIATGNCKRTCLCMSEQTLTAVLAEPTHLWHLTHTNNCCDYHPAVIAWRPVRSFSSVVADFHQPSSWVVMPSGTSGTRYSCNVFPLQRSPTSNDSMAGGAAGKGKRGGMLLPYLCHISNVVLFLAVRDCTAELTCCCTAACRAALLILLLHCCCPMSFFSATTLLHRA